MDVLKKTLFAIFAAFLFTAVAGCEREGPAERTGEDIDRGVEQAGDEAEQAGDRMQEGTER